MQKKRGGGTPELKHVSFSFLHLCLTSLFGWPLYTFKINQQNLGMDIIAKVSGKTKVIFGHISNYKNAQFSVLSSLSVKKIGVESSEEPPARSQGLDHWMSP